VPGSELTQQVQIHTLYSDHHGWLRGWLGKKLGCTERAADLMHDTFLRLLTQDKLQNLQQPRAYLLTIARRVLVDHWRREQVERAYLEALAQLPEQYAPGPEEKYLILEILLDIDRRLAGLPVVVKHAFLHAQLGGLKQQQIADELGVSLSTVKRYLTQAYTQCYFALEVGG
jgi:RNA polymerase sigma-70 factor (ECF subfamily)